METRIILALGVWLALAAERGPAASSGGPEPRPGSVEACGSAFCDDEGPYWPLGATLFPALWLFEHEPERLDENLRWLVAHGLGPGDFLRVFVEVGGDWWRERALDPHREDAEARLGAFLDLLRGYGLRAEITVFGGLSFSTTDEARRAVLDMVARVAGAHRDVVLFIELGNESWHVGYDRIGYPEALREDTRYLRARWDGLLAPSSPQPGAPEGPHAWDEAAAILYDDLPEADVVTWHLNRWMNVEPERQWRAVRQPWPYAALPFAPAVRVNNEPYGNGPGVTVGYDDSPVRNAAHLFYTAISGFGGFVWHQTAGILMGGRDSHDIENLWENPNAADTLALLARVRDRLPPDIANWRRAEPGDGPPESSAYPFTAVPSWLEGEAEGVTRALAACEGDDGRCLVGLIGLKGRFATSCARPLAITVYDPAAGTEEAETCAAGDPFVVEGDDDPFDERRDFLIVETRERGRV